MKGAAPLPLVNFSDPSSIGLCKRMSDADIGGYSEIHLDFVPQSPPHARFHGNISIQLPQDNPNVTRTGFAGWRTHDRPPTIFGKSLFDLDPYKYLALRVKSDGRKYFVNVQTESVVPTDLHQHRLFARKPGEWETVLIKLSEFVRTNHGIPVEPQKEMMRQRVRSVGISLTDRVPGPYELCIGKIWATNELSESESEEDARLDEITKAPSEEPTEAEKPRTL
ncbi:putative complex i intermediate-associated protein 30 protein [Lasiodiplodia theobromae]|nr:Complex i intermediate-associated protein 30 protein [Lasiodiplodia theobromae]KAF4541366.1 Complex i intermediate-associated protein 30 protein [Lasiodiplodia theobromae]KAF9632670.1 putative complex i intermediate-associated protein 30 protein [Lasiodiplodia theobromae]